MLCCAWSLSRVFVTFETPGTGARKAQLLYAWDSPGKNIGVGCHALLQGIFQHRSPALLMDSLLILSHQKSPN